MGHHKVKLNICIMEVIKGKENEKGEEHTLARAKKISQTCRNKHTTSYKEHKQHQIKWIKIDPHWDI